MAENSRAEAFRVRWYTVAEYWREDSVRRLESTGYGSVSTLRRPFPPPHDSRNV